MRSPAGDNAVEHYLEARAVAAERVHSQAALADSRTVRFRLPPGEAPDG